MHVEALKMMAEHTAPGEKPQFLGVRYCEISWKKYILKLKLKLIEESKESREFWPGF